MNLVSSSHDTVYLFSFTAVDSEGHSHDTSYCTEDYLRATYTYKMDVCENYDSPCCGEENCPDPCTHSSTISKLSDDKTYWYAKSYTEHGCKEENFEHNSAKKPLDVCYSGEGNTSPSPCNPEANFDACALRYNQTNAGDDTCNGMKDGYCYDKSMYSLSNTLPK